MMPTRWPACMREPRAPGPWRTAITILRKDLLLELRGLETVPAMVLLALTTLVVFHFALNRDTIEGQLAAGAPLGLVGGLHRRTQDRAVPGELPQEGKLSLRGPRCPRRWP